MQRLDYFISETIIDKAGKPELVRTILDTTGETIVRISGNPDLPAGDDRQVDYISILLRSDCNGKQKEAAALLLIKSLPTRNGHIDLQDKDAQKAMIEWSKLFAPAKRYRVCDIDSHGFPVLPENVTDGDYLCLNKAEAVEARKWFDAHSASERVNELIGQFFLEAIEDSEQIQEAKRISRTLWVKSPEGEVVHDYPVYFPIPEFRKYLFDAAVKKLRNWFLTFSGDRVDKIVTAGKEKLSFFEALVQSEDFSTGYDDDAFVPRVTCPHTEGIYVRQPILRKFPFASLRADQSAYARAIIEVLCDERYTVKTARRIVARKWGMSPEAERQKYGRLKNRVCRAAGYMRMNPARVARSTDKATPDDFGFNGMKTQSDHSDENFYSKRYKCSISNCAGCGESLTKEVQLTEGLPGWSVGAYCKICRPAVKKFLQL